MKLNNYNYYLSKIIWSGNTSQGSTSGAIDTIGETARFTQKLEMPCTKAENESYKGTSSTDYYGCFILCGNGTKEVERTDYKLDNAYDGNTLKAVATSCGATIDGGDYMTVSRTLKNITDEDVTVTELGLYVSSTSGSYYPVLLHREVLQEPVVIKAGETQSFSVTMR